MLNVYDSKRLQNVSDFKTDDSNNWCLTKYLNLNTVERRLSELINVKAGSDMQIFG